LAYPENGKGLDVASGGDVRSSAQIDQGTASVHSTLGAIGNTLLNEILLVLAVLEHLKELVLGHFQTLERLLLFDNVVGELLEGLLILISDDLPRAYVSKVSGNLFEAFHALSHVGHIVVEPRGVFSRGTVAQIATKAFLGSLSKNMG
jgi:hypothetical protein